jgi:hypothetical protein
MHSNPYVVSMAMALCQAVESNAGPDALAIHTQELMRSLGGRVDLFAPQVFPEQVLSLYLLALSLSRQ